MKYKKDKLLIFLYLTSCILLTPILISSQQTQCAADFSQIVDKVTLDYAGYSDKTRGKEKQIVALTKKIKALADQTEDFTACTKILQQWVNSFKDGHLFLVVKGEETMELKDFTVQKEFLKPTFKVIDKETFLLKIPAFDLNYKPVIDDLLKEHNQEILKSQNLILDLRGNKGGGDSSFKNLIPLIYTNPIKLVGASIWSSKAIPSPISKFR